MTPGIGTVVKYHSTLFTGDQPGIVAVTQDSWNSSMSGGPPYTVPQPSAGQVIIAIPTITSFGNGTYGANWSSVYATEGTSAGQFSLIMTESEDV